MGALSAVCFGVVGFDPIHVTCAPDRCDARHARRMNQARALKFRSAKPKKSVWHTETESARTGTSINRSVCKGSRSPLMDDCHQACDLLRLHGSFGYLSPYLAHPGFSRSILLGRNGSLCRKGDSSQFLCETSRRVESAGAGVR